MDTPLLCASTATDPWLRSYRVPTGPDSTAFLQTSPEFCMKRLLCAYPVPIYQICKAFRYEDSGRRHEREFTLLEWYRPDWSLLELTQELEQLITHCANSLRRAIPTLPQLPSVEHLTYASAFEAALGINPHNASTSTLRHYAQSRIDGDFIGELERDGLLDLLMSHLVEPTLPVACILTEFPASQAALAATGEDAAGHSISLRAELYLHQLEIANGYQELLDGNELAARSTANIEHRRQHGLDPVPTPDQLLAAMHHGLPRCAGIAVGVDRLFMALTQCDLISHLLSFAGDRA